MITKEEYLEALDIIKKYAIQLESENLKLRDPQEDGNENRLLVEQWMDEHYWDIDVKLHKALTNKITDYQPDWFSKKIKYEPRFKYMDEINRKSFLEVPGIGLGTWLKFCKISGFNPNE